MRENSVIKRIENQLNANNRYFVNIHGSMFSRNGTPDIVTHGKNGDIIFIEAKAPGKELVVNQWRHFVRILNSGGRAVVAYEDFSLQKLDDGDLPKVTIGSIVGVSDMIASKTITLSQTTEVILDGEIIR